MLSCEAWDEASLICTKLLFNSDWIYSEWFSVRSVPGLDSILATVQFVAAGSGSNFRNFVSFFSIFFYSSFFRYFFLFFAAKSEIRESEMAPNLISVKPSFLSDEVLLLFSTFQLHSGSIFGFPRIPFSFFIAPAFLGHGEQEFCWMLARTKFFLSLKKRSFFSVRPSASPRHGTWLTRPDPGPRVY